MPTSAKIKGQKLFFHKILKLLIESNAYEKF